MMVYDADEVRRVVTELVHIRFADAEIVKIEIKEAVDFDDDTILKVQVVFKTDNERLDAKATSSFLRYLRPKLSEIGVNLFPVMSFISDRDAKGAAA